MASISLFSLCGFCLIRASSWNFEFCTLSPWIVKQIRVDYFLCKSDILSSSFKQCRFMDRILPMIPQHKRLLKTVLLHRFLLMLLLLVPLLYFLLQHLKRLIIAQTALAVLFINFRWRVYLAIEKVIDMPNFLTFFIVIIAVRLLFPIFELSKLLVPFDELIAGFSHNLVNRTHMQSVRSDYQKPYFSWWTL